LKNATIVAEKNTIKGITGIKKIMSHQNLKDVLQTL